MKTTGAVLTIIFLMMVGTTVWAEDQVLTIYFAGTGATKNWVDPNVSGFGNSEVLSSLFAEQKESLKNNRVFVDGIGTFCTCGCWWDWSITWLNIFSKLDADIELCKGWEASKIEAWLYLYATLAKNPEDMILNLVGWSRGGVLTMRFAHMIKTEFPDMYARIKRINILAIDPAGHRTMFATSSVPEEEFCLDEKVKQYVGIYALDERTWMFGPAIPDVSAVEDVLLLGVPGSHETVVGNTQTDGHNGHDNLNCGGAECYDVENFSKVSWVTKAIVKKLLSSSQWGYLEFNSESPWNTGLHNDIKRTMFINTYETMKDDSSWGSHYTDTRRNSIGGLGFENYGVWGLGCVRWANWEWEGFDIWNVGDRCASLFTSPDDHKTVALKDYLSQKTGAEVWAKLGQLGNSPPVALCKDAIVPADSTCKGSALIDNGSFDQDGDLITILQSPSGPYSLGNTSVTLTVTDSKGASNQCSGTVTVVDTQAPNLTCPTTQIIDATGPGGVVVNFSPTTSDNCPGAISVSCIPDSGTMFAIGSTSVTCSAKDASENSTSCSFNVTIRGPIDQINSLAALVKGFNLPSDIGNSLVAKLSNARTQFSARNTKAACNVIDAFINEVSAQTGKKITADQANQMIANALRIKAVMGR